MLIQQMSVFLENKTGVLAAFIKKLSENNINLRGLSIAEAQDYGVVRMIVDNPEEAIAKLRALDCSCKLTRLVAVTLDDKPGSMNSVLSLLAERNIPILYTYAFLSETPGKVCIALRVPDCDKAEELIREAFN